MSKTNNNNVITVRIPVEQMSIINENIERVQDRLINKTRNFAIVTMLATYPTDDNRYI